MLGALGGDFMNYFGRNSLGKNSAVSVAWTLLDGAGMGIEIQLTPLSCASSPTGLSPWKQGMLTYGCLL